ncbi:iron hydrogenase [Lepidopterella palustris CBS 459.81]|uniref:Cytosolic Fe-S cluster assembly factor NAR1 n=1 Tax=Lepidopterella palustris CBS 459.81 TaxID=1314670 RepID=A0A8E2E8E0_9PEZI|nr:iron hydrogenase [Lepidopterella palustris CBS 459.81]
MSAILSADDLNDFISPGVACIKPLETLPAQTPEDSLNAYEVTTEDKVAASNPPAPAQISLTDCLACSGCVTSAEAVLVSLQSHTEVLNTLDAHPSLHPPWIPHNGTNGTTNGASNKTNGLSNGIHGHRTSGDGKIFVASVSPQTRASVAAVFSVSESQAGNMIIQLLSGPMGLKAGGAHGSGFTWVIDTNVVRDACLVAAADEVVSALSPSTPTASGGIVPHPKKPILTSACPGWICYAEKTHPYILSHLSRLKSPQALTGTLIKSVLSQTYNIPPGRIWHLAIMPCFDKKLEASRNELTSATWLPAQSQTHEVVRDVDCVITARELLHMASMRNIAFANLPTTPLPSSARVSFPDPKIDKWLFPDSRRRGQESIAGPSGGYLYHILRTYQARNPGSEIKVERGRNADVVEYALINSSNRETIIRMARFYGFRNIQNLVRRLKPVIASRMPGAKGGVSRRPAGGAVAGEGVREYAYVEVMACPGGCTNGGGQVKVGEVEEVRAEGGCVKNGVVEGGGGGAVKPGPKEQKEWLRRVDEAYFSACSSSSEESESEDVEVGEDEDQEMRDADVAGGEAFPDVVNGISRSHIGGLLDHWARITNVEMQKLLYTSYRKVESDVGKKKQSDVERVVGLASSLGGGW